MLAACPSSLDKPWLGTMKRESPAFLARPSGSGVSIRLDRADGEMEGKGAG